MKNNNKIKKIFLLITMFLIIGTVVGLLVFKNNKNELTPDQPNNNEVVEKEVKLEKIIYVKIDPLVKITYEEIYKLCGTKICGEIESNIIKTEMLNEEAERIYENVNLEGMNIYNGIEKLVNVAKERGINTENISLYYDSENFDKKELVLEENIIVNDSYTTIVDEEILKKDIVTYVVTFNSDGGTSMPSQTIECGKKGVKPSNPIKEGYTFVEWQLNGKTYNFDNVVTGNITLKAVWKINKYTVTFNSDGGTSVPNQTIENGKKATRVSNPTKEGYTFVEWQLNGKTYNFDNAVTRNITLKAVWKKNNTSTATKYTVTFNSDGGTSVPNQTIESGKKATKPANPIKGGYTFVEWQLNGKTYNFDNTVTRNITLKAVWKKNNTPTATKYTVSFNSDGGSAVVSQTIESGKKATKPSNPTKEGYTFVEWQLNGKTYNFDNAVTGNITLKAVWKNNLWDIDSTGAIIKYKGTGESVVIPNEIDGIIPVSIKAGAFDVSGLSSITLSNSIVSVEAESIVKRSLKVLNVYITASQFDNNSWLKVIKGYSSMTIHRSQQGTFMYATLPGNIYTAAIYNKVGGYELSYAGNCNTLPAIVHWHIKTEDYSLPNISAVGYTFNGWTDENGGSPKKDFVIPKGNTKDKSLYAHCDVNKWSFKLVYDEGALDYSKVNYNKNPYCGSSYNYCKYKYTDTVEIPYNQVIREGYTFNGWATTKTGTVVYKEGQKISRVVSQNNGQLTLYARWKKN